MMIIQLLLNRFSELQQFFDTFWPHDRDRPRELLTKGPCQRYKLFR